MQLQSRRLSKTLQGPTFYSVSLTAELEIQNAHTTITHPVFIADIANQ